MAGITASAILFYLFHGRKNVRFTPLLLFLALGCLAILPWVSPCFPPNHIVFSADNTRHRVTGTICDLPSFSNNRTRFILRVSALDGLADPVTGQIRVTAFGDFSALAPGDRIFFSGKIRRPRNFSNPGGFDYERFMAFREIWATAYVRKGTLRRLERGSLSGTSASVRIFRGQIRAMIRSVAPEAASAGILSALLIGDKSGISPELRDRFSRAGIAHLLAISGLHISIIGGIIAFLLCPWVLARSETLLWRGWLQKAAALHALAGILAYGLISGLSPATQRALIMAVALSLILWVSREPDAINTLALAALVILILHPPALFSISFQLSFAAVGTIVYGFSCTGWRSGGKQGIAYLKFRIFQFTAVSLFATLGTLPLTLFYFHQFSFAGILSNLVFIPLICFVVLPMGLFAILSYLILPAAGTWLMSLSAILLTGVLRLVPWFGDLPLTASDTVIPSVFEIICYYASGWAILTLIGRRSTAPGKKKDDLQRWARWVLALSVVAMAGDGLYWFYERFWHDDLRVTVIDVGQGSSALVEFPGGTCMLIDGGGFYDNSAFDVGKNIVAPLLLGKKIRTLDAVVLSHPDGDHLNGLLYIVGHLHVKQVWASGVKKANRNYRNFAETIARNGTDAPAFRDIPRSREIGGVHLDLLYPPPDFDARSGAGGWRGKCNNTSLVIRLRCTAFSVLFPGDIEAEAEADLVRRAGDKLASDILIAPHHGSKTSSTEEFLNAVSPDTVIVSAGWKNRFGCPRPSVIQRYRARGCGILRTDQNGAICIRSDGNLPDIKPYKK
ncbi:DNA internalization-related competence protein ComEC/Rec2 [Desulfonema ishimotonii]|uniref:DNA internalization-related competence protein ComEC/Rec2 n=1 Tax=Desulfonema ishimotonii TaxID=45657 RepID=UPI001408835D|nr:DNA internalization-related competence protein ComEC/Rec2 [Desulfonema ishimotonii]